MSNRLLNEVFNYVRDDLTPAERLVLLAVADEVRDDRAGSNRGECVVTEALLCRKTGLSPDALKKAKQRLAARDLEVRVPLRDVCGKPQTDGRGRPTYAHEGHATRYALPVLALPRGGNTVPPLAGAASDGAEGEETRPPSGGNLVPPLGSSEGGTWSPSGGNTVPPLPPVGGTQSLRGGNVFPQRGEHVPPDSLKTLKNPLSLSPSPTRASDAAPRPERDKDPLVQQLVHVLRDHHATAAEAAAVLAVVRSAGRISSLAAWAGSPTGQADAAARLVQLRADAAARLAQQEVAAVAHAQAAAHAAAAASADPDAGMSRLRAARQPFNNTKPKGTATAVTNPAEPAPPTDAEAERAAHLTRRAAAADELRAHQAKRATAGTRAVGEAT